MTTIREAQPLGRPMQPLILCAYEVDAEPVFNATDAERCCALDVTEADLAGPTWEAEMLAGSVPAPQVLADRLIASGYVGMLVCSFARGAAPEDRNLVVWKWGNMLPARILLINDEGRLSEGSVV